jgi:hypothetical protein
MEISQWVKDVSPRWLRDNSFLSKFLGAAVVVATILFIVSCYIAWDARDKLAIEVAKSSLQFVIIVIGGAIVSTLLKSFEQAREASLRSVEQDRAESLKSVEKAREDAQTRSRLRTEFLDRLGEAYRSVKRARRALRAAGLTNKFGDTASELTEDQIAVYFKEMETLNDVQLSLEGLKIQASSLPALLGLKDEKKDQGKGEASAKCTSDEANGQEKRGSSLGRTNKNRNVNIWVNLERMEKYLREVLVEYEENCPRWRAKGAESLNFGEMCKLREFTGSTKNKKTSAPEPQGAKKSREFITDFAMQYDKIIKTIASRLI